jgi:hypothetical protein
MRIVRGNSANSIGRSSMERPELNFLAILESAAIWLHDHPGGSAFHEFA